MVFTSINPATAEKVWACDAWDSEHIERALAETALATPPWAATQLTERCRLLRRADKG